MSQATAADKENAEQGIEPGQAAEAQPLDFSQPTRFTADLRQRIARTLEPFCEVMSARLSAELGAPVEVSQKADHQHTWSVAHAALPDGALRASILVRPTARHMLLALDQPLAMRTLNCLVGGRAADAPEARRLSEIDRALLRRLLDAMVVQLGMAWRDLDGQELVLGEIDLGAEPDDSVPSGEPTLTVVMECAIDGLGAELSLLVPWNAVESFGAHGHGAGVADPDPQQAKALRHGLAGAKMLVRAEIGATRLPVERVLAIEPGGLLRLDAKAELGVRLVSERVMLARGLPGRSGGRRAVKLSTAVEPLSDPSIRPLPAAASHRGAGSSEDAAALLERLSHLKRIELHVWAELGRTRLSLGNALSLPQGALVELDEGAEDPVGIFVNGLRLASGALAVTNDGEWAVQVQSLG